MKLSRLPHLLLGSLLWLSAVSASGHEIPADVRVQVLLGTEGSTLSALVRVPLEAMRDIEFARTGPGYLDLTAIEPQLVDAARLWVAPALAVLEDGKMLPATIGAVRVALPSDVAFADYDRARRALRDERLPRDTQLFWEHALLDVALSFPNVGAAEQLVLEPQFARLGLRTVTELRTYLQRDSEDPRSFVFIGDPGPVHVVPGRWLVFRTFLEDGFGHVLGGLDHLLFLLALVLPVRRFRPLVVTVTAFTLAHSITLTAALLGLTPDGLWFPPLVELLIAASIVYMAFENLLVRSVRRRWLAAYGFGLVHGFGFSFALRDTLQLAGEHLPLSLLSFNLGIELGQLLVLAGLVPLLVIVTRHLPERPVVLVVSALVAHTGWHWLTERWSVLSAYSLQLPVPDAALLATGLRWLLLALVAATVVWVVRRGFDRWADAR